MLQDVGAVRDVAASDMVDLKADGRFHGCLLFAERQPEVTTVRVFKGPQHA